MTSCAQWADAGLCEGRGSVYGCMKLSRLGMWRPQRLGPAGKPAGKPAGAQTVPRRAASPPEASAGLGAPSRRRAQPRPDRGPYHSGAIVELWAWGSVLSVAPTSVWHWFLGPPRPAPGSRGSLLPLTECWQPLALAAVPTGRAGSEWGGFSRPHSTSLVTPNPPPSPLVSPRRPSGTAADRIVIGFDWTRAGSGRGCDRIELALRRVGSARQ